jgi:hypothetical protein
LGLCQQEPSFGQNEPRPSVLAIVAAVCLAKAFSCVHATVVAFGHRGNDDSESLPIPFSRSAARGLLLTSPPLPPPWSVDQNDPLLMATVFIPLQRNGGTYVVPVLINRAITLNFVIDSGATDVSIPADVVMTLIRTGTLQDADFVGTQTYKLADGSTVPSTTFRIRSLKANKVEIENVKASIAPVAGELLLGQSFLNRFRSWSIDNAKQALVLTP